MSAVNNMDSFGTLLKENPKSTVVSALCQTQPKKNLTVGEMFENYFQTYDFTGRHWRWKHARTCRKCLEFFKDKNLSGITIQTLADFFESQIKNGVSPKTMQVIWMDFQHIVKFIVDGADKKKSAPRAAAIPDTSQSDDNQTIKIKHHVMSVEEALRLVTRYQGEYAAIRLEIKEQLNALPDGQAYVFQAQNLDEAKLKSLLSSINNMLRTDKMPFVVRYSKVKKVFILLPEGTIKQPGRKREGK